MRVWKIRILVTCRVVRCIVGAGRTFSRPMRFSRLLLLLSASLGRSNLSETHVRSRSTGKELLHIMPTPFVAGTGAPDLSAEELDLEFDEVSELESVESEPTFSDLGASEAVIAALAARGVISPFEIQARVIPDAIAGHDVLAKSRTGSGKTLAFAIPIVERLEGAPARPKAVVMVPTRELASQVTEEFQMIAKPKGLRVASVYGGVGLIHQARNAPRAQIIVATPGRLYDLIQRRSVSLKEVTILVLDEADRLLDMGFKPQVDRIAMTIPSAGRQTMFFSATLDGDVGMLASQHTNQPRRHETISPRETVDSVAHRFVPDTMERKTIALAELLEQEAGQSLVFVTTKRAADRLVHAPRTAR